MSVKKSAIEGVTPSKLKFKHMFILYFEANAFQINMFQHLCKWLAWRLQISILLLPTLVPAHVCYKFWSKIAEMLVVSVDANN